MGPSWNKLHSFSYQTLVLYGLLQKQKQSQKQTPVTYIYFFHHLKENDILSVTSNYKFFYSVFFLI